jgi:hypothetical protein
MAEYALNKSWDLGWSDTAGSESDSSESDSKVYLDPARAAVRRDPS